MGLLVDMIDVGQGDSFLLTVDGPTGEAYVLVDAGLPGAGTKVLNYINKYASSGLDMIIATHIDNDHVGGLATVLSHAPLKQGARFVLNVPPAIKNRWTPARQTLEKYKGVVSFRKLIEAVDLVETLCSLANRRGLVHTEMLRGWWWLYGAVRLTVLNPTAERLAEAWEENTLDDYIKRGWDAGFVSLLESVSKAPPTSAENDSSIVIEIAVNDVPKGLMTSDAGAAVLKEVTNNKSYQFLKVPHHGSDTGLDAALIRQIRPINAAIPVGENPHGHPCIEVLDLLRKSGARTYCSSKTENCRRSCTFKGGDISFPIDKALRSGWEVIASKLCENNFARQQ
jgi:beta-lactamase superfamily II metal-dependent hydrolase